MVTARSRAARLYGVVTLSMISGVAPSCADRDSAAPTSVILFLGDGMGLGQIGMLTQYRRLLAPGTQSTAFELLLRQHHVGLSDVYALGSMTPDEGAAATQIACGQLTLPEVVGLDKDGYPCRTVLEEAYELGKATGLVTDVSVTNPTTAAFVAKQPGLYFDAEAASDMIEGTGMGRVQVLLGGGLRYFIPRGSWASEAPGCGELDPWLDGRSRRNDAADLVADAQARGYHFACTSAGLAEVPEAEGTRVLGLFAAAELPAFPERSYGFKAPSLRDMTHKALGILDKSPGGFFLVVEAGHIDRAGHDNDGAYLLGAMQDASATLLHLMRYVDEHPGTLLIVAGTSEVGGMRFGHGRMTPVTERLPSGADHVLHFDHARAVESYGYLLEQRYSLGALIDDIIDRLYLPGYELDPSYSLHEAVIELSARVEAHTRYSLSEARARAVLHVAPATAFPPIPGVHDRFYLYRPFRARLASELVDATRLVWAAGTHSSEPVPVMSMGPRELASQLEGYGHNADIGRVIFDALRGE